ncbi:MAG: hypothetical protein LBU07_05635 [Coriobacteriales bacterium]|jgi:hypothetical protein|nr:hypothetical protein [Coriobacteriales bacterium]
MSVLFTDDMRDKASDLLSAESSIKRGFQGSGQASGCLSSWLYREMGGKRCAGQATVEYLVVCLALITITVVLGLLTHHVSEGLFVEHAAESASHSLTTNTAGSIGDVLLY